MNNPMQMISEFNRFRQTYKGDPKKEVLDLVRTGKMTQSQLNQLQQMASQFQDMMNMFK